MFGAQLDHMVGDERRKDWIRRAKSGQHEFTATQPNGVSGIASIWMTLSLAVIAFVARVSAFYSEAIR